MFSKETYVNRRNELKKLVKSGIIILFGNNESPNNYPNNVYYPFRQDSSFLYYFGLQRDGLVGVIDVDNDTETLIGNDIDIEDIVWYGSVDSVRDLAAQALESIASDRCDAVGDGHGGKAGIFESITSDGCHLTRSIHISDFFWDTLLKGAVTTVHEMVCNRRIRLSLFVQEKPGSRTMAQNRRRFALGTERST